MYKVMLDLLGSSPYTKIMLSSLFKRQRTNTTVFLSFFKKIDFNGFCCSRLMTYLFFSFLFLSFYCMKENKQNYLHCIPEWSKQKQLIRKEAGMGKLRKKVFPCFINDLQSFYLRITDQGSPESFHTAQTSITWDFGPPASIYSKAL